MRPQSLIGLTLNQVDLNFFYLKLVPYPIITFLLSGSVGQCFAAEPDDRIDVSCHSVFWVNGPIHPESQSQILTSEISSSVPLPSWYNSQTAPDELINSDTFDLSASLPTQNWEQSFGLNVKSDRRTRSGMTSRNSHPRLKNFEFTMLAAFLDIRHSAHIEAMNWAVKNYIRIFKNSDKTPMPELFIEMTSNFTVNEWLSYFFDNPLMKPDSDNLRRMFTDIVKGYPQFIPKIADRVSRAISTFLSDHPNYKELDKKYFREFLKVFYKLFFYNNISIETFTATTLTCFDLDLCNEQDVIEIISANLPMPSVIAKDKLRFFLNLRNEIHKRDIDIPRVFEYKKFSKKWRFFSKSMTLIVDKIKANLEKMELAIHGASDQKEKIRQRKIHTEKRKRLAENLGMDSSIIWALKNGYWILDLTTQHAAGYDLMLFDPKTGQTLRVEVKATRNPKKPIYFSQNELKVAADYHQRQLTSDLYMILVVEYSLEDSSSITFQSIARPDFSKLKQKQRGIDTPMYTLSELIKAGQETITTHLSALTPEK